jgi:hypothetical protein
MRKKAKKSNNDNSPQPTGKQRIGAKVAKHFPGVFLGAELAPN